MGESTMTANVVTPPNEEATKTTAYGKHTASIDKIVDALLTEYAAMREEIRMVLSSMETGLNTLMLAIGGVASVAAVAKDERVLFLLPSVVCFFGIGQLMRATTANVLGVHCQRIEARIREICGKHTVVMDWEGGLCGVSSRIRRGLSASVS